MVCFFWWSQNYSAHSGVLLFITSSLLAWWTSGRASTIICDVFLVVCRDLYVEAVDVTMRELCGWFCILLYIADFLSNVAFQCGRAEHWCNWITYQYVMCFWYVVSMCMDTGRPLVWKPGSVTEIGQSQGNVWRESCREKLSVVYFMFGAISVFSL